MKKRQFEEQVNTWGKSTAYEGAPLDEDLLAALSETDNSAVYAERDTLRKRIEALESQLLEQQSGSAISLGENDEFVVGGYRLSQLGLVRESSETSEIDIQAVGVILFRFQESLQWLIGDWLNEAQVFAWGDVNEIARTFKRSAKTLQNWKSVSSNISYLIRQSGLEFGHHEAVASLSPALQSEWLTRALQGDQAPSGTQSRWSVKRLRDEIAGRVLPSGNDKNTKTFKPMKRAFSAIWRAVQAQETPKKEDILALEKWLTELKKQAK